MSDIRQDKVKLEWELPTNLTMSEYQKIRHMVLKYGIGDVLRVIRNNAYEDFIDLGAEAHREGHESASSEAYYKRSRSLDAILKWTPIGLLESKPFAPKASDKPKKKLDHKDFDGFSKKRWRAGMSGPNEKASEPGSNRRRIEVGSNRHLDVILKAIAAIELRCWVALILLALCEVATGGHV
jgi:hypothetical protein